MYNDLEVFIKSKKNEQIQYYQLLWKKFRLEYSSITSEMTKASQMFKDKVREIADRNSKEHLLFNYNIASHLVKVEDLLAPLG
jgi:hypothetical protein